jgi:hypothetical protein
MVAASTGEVAMKLRPHNRAVLPAVLFGLALLAASAHRAQAFTFEDRAESAPTGGAANIADPDERLNTRASNGNQQTFQQGNTSFRFGGQAQSFDQRNNPNSYFNPNTLMGK